MGSFFGTEPAGDSTEKSVLKSDLSENSDNSRFPGTHFVFTVQVRLIKKNFLYKPKPGVGLSHPGLVLSNRQIFTKNPVLTWGLFRLDDDVVFVQLHDLLDGEASVSRVFHFSTLFSSVGFSPAVVFELSAFTFLELACCYLSRAWVLQRRHWRCAPHEP